MDRITKNMNKCRAKRKRKISKNQQKLIFQQIIMKHKVEYEKTLNIRSQIIEAYKKTLHELYEEFGLLIIEFERMKQKYLGSRTIW